MYAIAVSRADGAAVTIADHLKERREWTTTEDDSRPDAAGGGTVYRSGDVELREFEEWHLHLEDVADAFSASPEWLVFPSRHSGDTGPLLTAHFTGNFGRAEHGGEDRALAAACPSAHKAVVEALDRHAPETYDVGMECTHHGPTDVGAPSMFVEIGSDESQWADEEAGDAVARAILDAVGEDALTDRTVVGFGGGHYAPRFGRIVTETDWAVGHVAADWGLEDLGVPAHHEDVLDRIFEASGTDLAVVEGERPDLESVIDDLGCRVVSETWVREVDGVPLDVVEPVEAALGPVETGTRFGALAGETDGEVTVVDVSSELLAEAHGVDQEATLEAVAATAVAYDTSESGNRVAGRVAVPPDGDGDDVIEALLDVLRREYDAVERDGDVVRLEETAFDPELASDYGVPEGPKFGRLAAGESVQVDGETVKPADVHVERTHNIGV